MLTFKQLLQENEISISDLHKSLSKHYDPTKSKHPNSFEHQKALEDYTSDSFKLNRYHWSKFNNIHPNSSLAGIKAHEEHSKVLDEAMKSHKTPHAFTVYSGIKGDPRERESYGILHHPAYLSTSLNKKIAHGFAKHHKYNQRDSDDVIHRHVMQIHVPADYPGIYVGGFSTIKREKEFILPRGMNLKLTGHSQTTRPSSLSFCKQRNNSYSQSRNHMKTFIQILEEEGIAKFNKLSKNYSYNKGESSLLKKYSVNSYLLNSYQWDKHNHKLKKGDDYSSDEKHTRNFDKLLKTHTTPKDLTVYSGLGCDPRVTKKKGELLHHPAYISTSLKKSVAKHFGNLNATEEHRHILKINVPKGHPGAYIEHVSNHPHEKEFILPRGTNLKITGHTEEPHIDRDNNRFKTILHTHEAEIV